MAQQPRTRRTPADDDGPDLDAAPAPETVPEMPQAPAAVSYTPDELQALIAEQVAQALIPLQQAQRATTVVNQQVIPPVLADPPEEPTFEPAYLPTDEDLREARALQDKGVDVDPDDYTPRAGTIIAVSPKGVETECTPKVFRTLLAGRGYVAHPDDAQALLASPHRVRSRRGGNVAGTQQTVAQGRRRRRTGDTD